MSSGSRRGWWLAGALALGATAVWAVVLARLHQQVEARPARERFLTWVGPDGPLGRNPSYPHCAGAAVVTTDRAWRTCYHSDASDPERHYIVRFELDRRRAVMMPLPDGMAASWPTAAAVSRDGDLALIAGGNVIRVDGDQATIVGRVSDYEVAGIAWVDDAIEVVQGWSAPEVLRFSEPPGRRALPRPPSDQDGERAPRLLGAWRGPSGWHLRFEMRDLGIERTPQPEGELLEGDERGTPWRATRVLRARDGGEVSVEDARTGLLAWSPIDWRWHQIRDGDGWRRFAHPLPDQAGEYDQLTADYLIAPDGLTSMHRVGNAISGAVETPAGWIGLAYEYDGKDSYLRVDDLDGHRGRRAVRWGWIDGRAVLVPASAGGWWLLGTFGTYIRIDGVERVDAPDTLGRIAEQRAAFDRLGMYNDWYGAGAFIKRAVYPVLLLGWPVAALAALISWLILRRRGVSLRTPLATTMAIYGAVALALLATFWDVTARL